MDVQEAQKAPSLRSVASNASIGSSTSLTRRSRTRTRSRTGTSPLPDSSFQLPITPPVPTVATQLFEGPMFQEPTEEADVDNLSVHSEGTPKYYKAAAQGQFQQPAPSAFSRVPSIPQLYDLGTNPNPNARDSMFTQGSGFRSGGSSSIYPASTSTASGTESPPSPRSIAEQLDDNDLDQDYDGDDVSYRLRLLVKNNYFLPPAHSKPSPTPRPPTTPTFFDFFRKSRSKPSTPTGSGQSFDTLMPALRTPSDQSTISPYPPPTPRRPSSSQAPPLPGRVMVVREKMHDIPTAAKLAEQEMKLRDARQESHPVQSDVDVIDPTDAVDLPPPSAAYPFAVQASALHEMGVQDSVGAALLADRLPPRSPNSAVSPVSVENEWRKALLHAAVNHSMNNSSAASSSPHAVQPVPSDSSPDSAKRMLDQRIMSPPLVDEPRISSQYSRIHSDDESDVDHRPSSTLPVRVETPLMPMTPLAPPPRRIFNPIYSLSQTSLPIDRDAARSPSSAQVRNDEPDPRLSDVYEAGVDRHAMLSPPPVIREWSEGSSDDRPRASSESRHTFYSEVEPDAALDILRPSMSSSIPENRASYSQPSPTVSAFQDAIRVSSPPPRKSSLRGSLDHPTLRQSFETRPSVSSPSPVPRASMASPPPRVSSSLAHLTPLSPPPRSSSLAQRLNAPPRPPPVVPPLPSDSEEILDPGPSTPPFPISGRRGTTTLVLEIPPPGTHFQSIRSAPAPSSSPPSFFDALQNQPNAMDDLDSSDDDDESYQASPSRPRGRRFSSTSARAPRSSEGSPVSSKKAVGNIPASGSFFKAGKSGKSDQGHGPPTSTFDFFQYTQQHPLTSAGESSVPRRPRTSDQAVRDWQTNQKEQASLRQLDGLLIQHMEAEKDKIRRLATTLRPNART
ncbi:hypothetical protein K438DRAFT_1817343 [Mycena galopus ATCC 62051]|nr:hypothetical protein K438DRAFT_1817343 [Mycena galopus ATCC 62051]